MKKIVVALGVGALAVTALSVPVQAEDDPTAACWGQASAAFAGMGVMGEHSSTQATPRLGLRNLARVLYAQGVIDDDSMSALGVFVATELGLKIEACGTD